MKTTTLAFPGTHTLIDNGNLKIEIVTAIKQSAGSEFPRTQLFFEITPKGRKPLTSFEVKPMDEEEKRIFRHKGNSEEQIAKLTHFMPLSGQGPSLGLTAESAAIILEADAQARAWRKEVDAPRIAAEAAEQARKDEAGDKMPKKLVICFNNGGFDTEICEVRESTLEEQAGYIAEVAKSRIIPTKNGRRLVLSHPDSTQGVNHKLPTVVAIKADWNNRKNAGWFSGTNNTIYEITEAEYSQIEAEYNAMIAAHVAQREADRVAATERTETARQKAQETGEAQVLSSELVNGDEGFETHEWCIDGAGKTFTRVRFVG